MATVSAEAAVQARGVSRPWRLLAGAFLVGALVVGLGVGPVGIGVTGIVQSALSHLPFLHVHSPLSSIQEAVLWQIRAPRVVLAAIVGAMLAVAGSSYQGVFHNPLADPYLLGVAAGSGAGRDARDRLRARRHGGPAAAARRVRRRADRASRRRRSSVS